MPKTPYPTDLLPIQEDEEFEMEVPCMLDIASCSAEKPTIRTGSTTTVPEDGEHTTAREVCDFYTRSCKDGVEYCLKGTDTWVPEQIIVRTRKDTKQQKQASNN